MPMEDLLTRQAPHSQEAEQSVLGSMLIDARCVPEVIEALRPEDLYLRTNREIYETIYSMFNFSLTIDPVTVLEHMKQNGVYDENTSRGYLLQLMDTTPTAANVVEYIGILKDKTLLRRVAEAAGDLTALIQQGTETGQDILEAAEQRIYAIRQRPHRCVRPAHRAGRQRVGHPRPVHRPDRSGPGHLRPEQVGPDPAGRPPRYG